jgi:hypothetical protein
MRERVMMWVGGGEHPLAPTYGAAAEIEAATQSSLGQLWQAHAAGALQIGEMAAIVTAGMNAAKADAAELRDVAEHIFDRGVGDVKQRREIAAFLAAMLWAPAEAREKLAAEWGEPETNAEAA